METQKKQFLVLAVLLAALAAAFFGLRAWQNRQAEKEEAEKEGESVTAASLDIEQATAFSYLLDGQELSFEREEGVWHYAGDQSIPLSQPKIDTMLGNLSEVKAGQKITAPENVSEYGFEDPSNVIKVRLGQEEVTFTLGMYNSITGQYYLMVSGSENVYLVDSQIPLAFRKSLEDLTEDPAEDTAEGTEDPAEGTEDLTQNPEE